MSSSRRCRIAASGAYLLVSLWVMGPVLPAPSQTLLGPPPGGAWEKVVRSDQMMVLWTVTRNARLFGSEPWNLRGDGQCYPLEHSYALGEHMFGEGLLAALPLRLSGDPILAYNAMLILSLWIPAMTMYALSFHLTRNPAAAFVAGLLFLVTRPRLLDPVHPYVHGDLWAPLVLLFLHRLFTRGGWRNALALGLALVLQLTESFYSVLACTIVAGVYAGVLAVRRFRDLPARVGPICLALALPIVAAWWILGPYLEIADLWGGLERPTSSFNPTIAFSLGHRRFLGIGLILLAAIGLLDRVARRRSVDGIDSRLPLLAGGLLVAWCSVSAIHVPWLGWKWPSPLLSVWDLVPGLSSVRVIAAVGSGVLAPAAALAGYGALVVVERVGRRGAVVVAAVLSLAILSEHFIPAWATYSFGGPVDLQSYRARPPEDDIRVVRTSVEGPVLDLPFGRGTHLLRALLVGAFHQAPLAMCANSFSSPIEAQVGKLARALPSPTAAEALAALGFRTVLVHAREPGDHDRFVRRARTSGGSLTALEASPGVVALRLAAPSGPFSDVSALGPGDTAKPPLPIEGPTATMPFEFHNPTDHTYLHPLPLEPTDLIGRWHRADGTLAGESPFRGLLPLAIARGANGSVDFEVPVPVPAGRYRLLVTRASEPDRVLAAREVEVLTESR